MIRRHKPIRMTEYDYAQAGVYAFTVVVSDRRCCLGVIEDEDAIPGCAGSIVRDVWEGLPRRFLTIMLDAFVVMPNHIHGIVFLGAESGFGAEIAINGDATTETDISVASPFMATGVCNQDASANKRIVRPPSRNPLAPALGEIVRSLKAASTTRIRKECLPNFKWQDGYWDRIVRNETELERYRTYIATNPVRWTMDREYAE